MLCGECRYKAEAVYINLSRELKNFYACRISYREPSLQCGFTSWRKTASMKVDQVEIYVEGFENKLQNCGGRPLPPNVVNASIRQTIALPR
jgi:hypothetical protein